MYTVQALWTQAREGLDVTTVLFSNRTYQILRGELANVGAGNPGRKALDMLDLGNPDIDWVGLAKSLGVPGARVTDMDGVQPPLRRRVGDAGAVSGRGGAVGERQNALTQRTRRMRGGRARRPMPCFAAIACPSRPLR